MRRLKSKKAFTLLELIVVMIIVAILAVLAFDSYEKEVEKGRAAEALANLGKLRKLAIVYYSQNETYPAVWLTYNDLGTDLPIAENIVSHETGCNNDNFYFKYACVAESCYAIRCSSDGKEPDASVSYTLKINIESGQIETSVFGFACGGGP